jgi:hypothetical protein
VYSLRDAGYTAMHVLRARGRAGRRPPITIGPVDLKLL